MTKTIDDDGETSARGEGEMTVEAAREHEVGGLEIAKIGDWTASTGFKMGEIAPDLAKCSARNILPSSPSETAFEEGPPGRRDPFLDDFNRALCEANRLQQEISKIEDEVEQATYQGKQNLAGFEIELCIFCLRACKLIEDKKIPASTVEEYAFNAGVRQHKNATIPCSPLMRAIVAQGTITGTPQMMKRRRRRATTYAGAIDYAIRKKLTEEEFRAELEGPPKKIGEYHGIEHLAAMGRAARAAERNGASPPLPPSMAYSVSGDFAGIAPGIHLMLVTVPDEGASVLGALLTVPDVLFRRVLAAGQAARYRRRVPAGMRHVHR